MPSDQLPSGLGGRRDRDAAVALGEVRDPQDVPRLVAAVEAVLAGYRCDGMPSPLCLSDGFSWPCLTWRAFARALDVER
jgi:hypothetical protein